MAAREAPRPAIGPCCGSWPVIGGRRRKELAARGRGKMAAVLEVEVGGPVEREVEEVRGMGPG